MIRKRSRLTSSRAPSATAERRASSSHRWSLSQSMARAYPTARNAQACRRAIAGGVAAVLLVQRERIANVSPSSCSVITSGSGPAATARPSRSSSAWVKPGGISSTWWETRIVAGEYSSSASRRQRRDQVLAAAEVEPGRGLVEDQQLGVGHQRAGDLHSLALPLAEGAEGAVEQGAGPDLAEQLAGAVVVELVVALAPAADHAVRRRHHHVADELVPRDPLGDGGAGPADPRPQLEDVDGADDLAEDADHAGGRDGSAPSRAASASSCRRRWGRGSPSARPPRPPSRRRRAGWHWPRLTVTSASSSTAFTKGPQRRVGIGWSRASTYPADRRRRRTRAVPTLRAVSSLPGRRRPGHLAGRRPRRAGRSGRPRRTPCAATTRAIWSPGCRERGVLELHELPAAARRADLARASRARATRWAWAVPATFNLAAIEAGQAVVAGDVGLVPLEDAARSSGAPIRAGPGARGSTSGRRRSSCARPRRMSPDGWSTSTSPSWQPEIPDLLIEPAPPARRSRCRPGTTPAGSRPSTAPCSASRSSRWPGRATAGRCRRTRWTAGGRPSATSTAPRDGLVVGACSGRAG